MIKVTVPIKLPGLNEYIDACRGNKYAGANMKRQSQDDCLIFIKAAFRGKTIKRAGFVFHWYEANKKRDKDNISSFGRKVFMDAIQKAGVIENDGWDQVAYLTDKFEIDKNNPRLEVEVFEIEPSPK